MGGWNIKAPVRGVKVWVGCQVKTVAGMNGWEMLAGLFGGGKAESVFLLEVVEIGLCSCIGG